MEMLEHEKRYSGEGGTDLNFKPGVHLDGFSFSDDDDMIHNNMKDLEGDQHKSAPRTGSSFQTNTNSCKLPSNKLTEASIQLLIAKHNALRLLRK